MVRGVIMGLLLAVLAALAGVSGEQKAAYDTAEAAYFECLRELPRAECVTILEEL